jgi:hypothetical protein
VPPNVSCHAVRRLRTYPVTLAVATVLRRVTQLLGHIGMHCKGALYKSVNFWYLSVKTWYILVNFKMDYKIQLYLVLFSPFEELCLRTAGIMESKGIHRVYEPSPVPTLYVGRVDDLPGRVPLILDGNATSTFPHKYSSLQRDAFECSCTDGAGPTLRRGSHVYEINTWLWIFGLPQPSVGSLSVAKTEKIQRRSLSEASNTDGHLSGLASDLHMVYAWYIYYIYLVNHAFLSAIK